MQVVILNYNAGNVESVKNALDRLGVEPIISDKPEVIAKADKVIFPGVGHAAPAMAHLQEHNLDKLIPQLKQPFLGICLGMQLLCSRSEEGETSCLGVFDAPVCRFQPDSAKGIKVPHMGWNTLQSVQGTLFQGLSPQDLYVYFVHSFFVPLAAHTTAQCVYGQAFSAALAKDNFFAVQFHPEKSSHIGSIILKNFLAL